MNHDFRLSADFASNLKFKRLLRKLGDHGALSWIRLLGYVARQRVAGALSDLHPEEIAEAAGYDRDANEFVDTLIDLRLLEKADDGGLVIHDWTEWNPWAAGAERRSEQARANAKSRWAKIEPEKRSEEARRAAQGRWRKERPSDTDASGVRAARTHNASGMRAPILPNSDPESLTDKDPARNIGNPSPTKPPSEAGEKKPTAKKPAANLFGEPDLDAMGRTDKAMLLLTAWHTEAPHLPQPHRLNDRWIGHCVQRLEKYSLAQMTQIFQRLERSDLARDGNWASFEWVIKSEANCEKVLSGQYDNRAKVVRLPANRPESVVEEAKRELQEARQREREAKERNDDGSGKPGNSFGAGGDFPQLEAGSGPAGGLRPVPRTLAV